ncbi:MAG: type II toxin-antitoxin system RelE/ParE family toxin [Candidatus Binataceae bacterium]
MSEVVLSELAEADFTDIWVFVAQDYAEAADRLLDRLHEKCQFLANSPEVGRQRPELDSSIRSFAVGNYVIFYRESANVHRSRSPTTRPSRPPISFPFLSDAPAASSRIRMFTSQNQGVTSRGPRVCKLCTLIA